MTPVLFHALTEVVMFSRETFCACVCVCLLFTLNLVYYN